MTIDVVSPYCNSRILCIRKTQLEIRSNNKQTPSYKHFMRTRTRPISQSSFYKPSPHLKRGIQLTIPLPDHPTNYPKNAPYPTSKQVKPHPKILSNQKPRTYIALPLLSSVLILSPKPSLRAHLVSRFPIVPVLFHPYTTLHYTRTFISAQGSPSHRRSIILQNTPMRNMHDVRHVVTCVWRMWWWC